MLGSTNEGWLYSLAQGDNSNWGETEEFYECVKSFGKGKQELVIDSRVWGTLHSTAKLPQAGDGFAFYHSTRAGFPSNDKFKRKPRISLSGTLLNGIDERNIHRIRVRIDAKVLEALQTRPIVRDDSTRSLFESCGIVQGAVASLYHAPPATWRSFSTLIRQRVTTPAQ